MNPITFASCTSCKKLLTNPVTLPCMHSFCAHCLVQNLSQNDSNSSAGPGVPLVGVCCNECEWMWTHEPPILGKFSTLLGPANVAKFLASQMPNRVEDVRHCDNCGDESEVYCIQCAEFHCPSCSQRHLNVPCAKYHWSITPEEGMMIALGKVWAPQEYREHLRPVFGTGTYSRVPMECICVIDKVNMHGCTAMEAVMHSMQPSAGTEGAERGSNHKHLLISKEHEFERSQLHSFLWKLEALVDSLEKRIALLDTSPEEKARLARCLKRSRWLWRLSKTLHDYSTNAEAYFSIVPLRKRIEWFLKDGVLM